MISGLSNKGRVEGALGWHTTTEVKGNEASFICVLNGGRTSVDEVHRFKPGAEQYCRCLVDLPGQTELIEEAKKKLVREMPMEPDDC